MSWVRNPLAAPKFQNNSSVAAVKPCLAYLKLHFRRLRLLNQPLRRGYLPELRDGLIRHGSLSFIRLACLRSASSSSIPPNSPRLRSTTLFELCLLPTCLRAGWLLRQRTFASVSRLRNGSRTSNG